MTTSLRSIAVPLAALGLLAGCSDSSLSVDLGAAPPADESVLEIVLPLRGIELREEGSQSVTLDADDSALVDMLGLVDGDYYALISDETLDAGHYTGVRLRLGAEEDAYLIAADGGEEPIRWDEADFDDAEIDLQVQDGDSGSVIDDRGEHYALTLVLDLRLSLAQDDDDDGYRLVPALRAVLAEDAGRIAGTVQDRLVEDPDCTDGREFAEGVAVFAFRGSGISPDDRDGAGVEPFASAPVDPDGLGGHRYDIADLPPDTYTLALSCRADEEDALDDDDLAFSETIEVDLDDAENETADFED